jgi:hypothetical protein
MFNFRHTGDGALMDGALPSVRFAQNRISRARRPRPTRQEIKWGAGSNNQSFRACWPRNPGAFNPGGQVFLLEKVEDGNSIRPDGQCATRKERILRMSCKNLLPLSSFVSCGDVFFK